MQAGTNDLHIRHGASFDEVCAHLSQFFFRGDLRKIDRDSAAAFSFTQYKRTMNGRRRWLLFLNLFLLLSGASAFTDAAAFASNLGTQ